MVAKLGDPCRGLLTVCWVSGKTKAIPQCFYGLSHGHSHSGQWMVSAKRDFDASLCSSEKKNQEVDQMVTFVPLILCILQHWSKWCWDYILTCFLPTVPGGQWSLMPSAALPCALGMWLSIYSFSMVLFYRIQDRVCGHLCNCTITIDCLIIC